MKWRALRLPDLDEVLARHLQRGLDRLGAAADEVGVARCRPAPSAISRSASSSATSVVKKLGVRVGELVDLRVHRRHHVGVPVAEAGHRGAAGGVEVLLAGGVDDEHAVAGDGTGGVRRRWRCRTWVMVGVGGGGMRSSLRRRDAPIPPPQRDMHGAAVRGRVGWSSQRAAVAGVALGPWPPPRRAGIGGPARGSTTPLAPRGAAYSAARCQWRGRTATRTPGSMPVAGRPMPPPQRGMHGAAVRGRVGWSSQRAAVTGVPRGPRPPPRRGDGRAARSSATPAPR